MATNNNANAIVTTTSLVGSAEEIHFLDAIVSQIAGGLIRVTVD
jgi:hypothetical protein